MKRGRVNQLLSPFYPQVTSRATRWQRLLGAVQGAWGAELGWVGLGCPKIADVEEMAGFDRAVVFA